MMNVSKTRLTEAKKKADALIETLSLTEKIGQLSQFGTSIYKDETVYYTDHYEEGKIGSYLTVKGAAVTNDLQKQCKEKFPTYIPLLFADDVIHGHATIFPTPLAQSCSWNPEKAKRGAEVAAKEASAAGVRWTFSPMVDIARDPRWGRIVEGYGEDPYLCSRFSEAVVRGYQGDEIGQKDHVLACMKHFVGYGACVGGRDYDSVDMSMQTLYDVYLPSFKAGIDAGAATVMSAFHTLNGVPCTGNKMLLTDILRNELGFDGIVISDAGSVWEMVTHGYKENDYEANIAAVNAGLNIMMAGDNYNNLLPKAIENGEITEAQIDNALRPVLTIKYLLGLFENPYVDEKGEECFFSKEHLTAAREIAEESVVLLENNGVLPLDSNKKIALIGPLADDRINILGCWTFMKDETKTVSILDGFKQAGLNVTYEKGCDFEEAKKEDIAAAVKAAKKAEVAVLVLGEREYQSGEAQSRAELRIHEAQLELLDAVVATGTPVVLLVSAGRPLVMEEYREKVDALVYMWQLGTETGHALANVLTGKCDVSGRLTASFPRHEGQLPVYYNRNNTGRPALGNVWYETGYKGMTTKARYPFGYGLSYTKFRYDFIHLSGNTMTTDGELTVDCHIKNIGDREGSTVAQLYVRDLVASCVRPIKELKGFQKISLKPGEETTVTFTLKADDLAFHNAEMKRVVEPGKFDVWIGQDSADETNGTSFTVI